MPNMIVTNEQLDVIYKKGDLDFFTIPEGYVSYNIYKIVDSRLAMDLRKLFSDLKQGATVAVSSYIPLPHKNGTTRFIKVYLVPVLNGRNQTYIYYFQSISGDDFPFLNQTESEPLPSSSQELEFELQRTKEHMQTLIEELETSNEELQSTNEELQSANEELQATNEEMETSNEELQSTNEELHTAYAELKEMYLENTNIKESYGALNDRYESVLDNINDGVVITNLEGIILKTNTAMQGFCRLPREQLLAKHWLNLAPVQMDIDFSNREKELTESGKFGPYNIHIKSENGMDTILRTEDYLSRDEKGNSQIWSFASDISKETYARQELLLSQQKFKATFDYANIGIAHVGLKGEWISVNKTISTMLGYSEEELMNLTFQNITCSDDLENDLVYFQELLDGKSDSYKVEKRYYKKDGELFWAMLSVSIIREQGQPKYFISVIEDINTQKRLSLDSIQAKTVFKTTQESIVITDQETNVINVNPSFENLTGYSIDDIKGESLSILRSEMHSEEFYNDLERAYKQSGIWSGEIICKAKNTDVFPVYLNISAVRDDESNIIQYVVVLTDISLIKQSQDKIQYLANHDSLTGLPNRTLLSDRVEHALQEARRSKKHIAVFFIDLDRFKIINDGLGHKVGDGVLIEVANRFTKVLRSEDTVARVGGDEFIVIAQDLDSALDASKIATNLLESIQKEMIIEEHKIKVGASIGISIYPNDGLSGDELIRQADIAMYDAKEHGRNIYRYISQELSSDAFEKATMESSIRDALNNDEFEIYYQPIVDVKTMTLSHLEALIRWNHPKLGLIMPNKFIPLAEESELITEITKYITLNVMRTIHEISKSNDYDCKVAINYSLKDLESDELFFTFKKYLQQFNIKDNAITLEITERKVILSNEQNQKHLARYKKLNVLFSMDDFGTGYSNLGYLINNPFDQLKIDRCFISKIGGIGTAEEVVKAAISIAKALQLKSVAEGIETQEQLEFVRDNGCDLAQGFYFQIPEPIAKLLGHLTVEKNITRKDQRR
ncbi:EAL domain-containing protein [Psychromonas sp. KJ10-2]|uniref:EAL domain-containing protein n=1 Tax=Psychromonas sp. KJ10-2 TaxID=3391822 RepID=UPI0039B5FAC0